MQRHQSRHLQCAKREDVEVPLAEVKMSISPLLTPSSPPGSPLLAAAQTSVTRCGSGYLTAARTSVTRCQR
eukprot:1608876-Heterocapsa_arctica.AAC.1